MTIEVTFIGSERHEELTGPLRTAFGFHYDPERAERVKRTPEVVEQRIGAIEDGKIVGAAASLRFEMTTPGGMAPVFGLTMVGVLPTHRRRGVLTRMIDRHLAQGRANGFPISALWASEGSIYGRFGYGVASLSGSVTFQNERVVFKRPAGREGVFRLLDVKEALGPCRAVWERVRPTIPGMLGRSNEWWEFRRLGDYDKSMQPLNRVVLLIDGRPEGYALYRLAQRFVIPGPADTTLSVIEAMGTSPHAEAMLWRYLCEIDLVRRIEAPLLSPTHPLLHMVKEPRRLALTVMDALWIRIVDAPAAFAARTFPSWTAVTFQLVDERCPWNAGVYRVEGGRVTRSGAAPELRFDAEALGSLYLGGVTARQLADAGAIEEMAEGAVDRADALFRSPRGPWCPEVF